MTPQAALLELLARVGSDSGAPILVSEYELSLWPSEAVMAMKTQRLLTKARPASSAICPGCERECVMPVHVLQSSKGSPAAFIVCDKRSDINRVPVPGEQLIQWQSTIDAVCGFVADSLALRRSDKRGFASADVLEIGVARGAKRSQMLCLRTGVELALLAGSNALPLADVVEYRSGAYALDSTRVRQLVDATTTADSRYTPSNAKREARKLDTQAMYKDWQKAYRELTRKRPNMAATWYSQQIAKMAISQGREPDTIKKNMRG